MIKLRNQLLALACIAVFLAIGYLYVRTWVVQKPFGVILFVSDSLVARHLTISRLYAGGAEYRLGLESFPHLALLRNAARDFAVPDDAAAASALATGVIGSHRRLSVDPQGKALTTISELARQKHRAIGIVTNGRLTAASPAAFYAHSADSLDSANLAVQLLERFRPEVALGGGARDFLPATRGGTRRDGRDLFEEFDKQGCEIARTKAELENLESFQEGGVLGVFGQDALAFSNDIDAASQPSLSDMVREAILFLENNRSGYFLVVDASLAGIAAERNEGEHAILETVALDRAIATAVKYAGDKSLVIAAGRHSTGGLSFNGYPLSQSSGVALLGNNPAGYPYLTWATGPNGPSQASGTPPRAKNEPAAFAAPSGMNNAEDVIALGRGAGSEKLSGFMDSTAIFEILQSQL